MVGNSGYTPPNTEPRKPSTVWDLIKAVAALIGLFLVAGAAAIGFLLYVITDGSFFN